MKSNHLTKPFFPLGAFLIGAILSAILVLSHPVTVAAAGSDDKEDKWGVLLLLASGPFFYGMVTLRYRNNDKRHHHEHETEATISNIKKTDKLLESKKSTHDHELPGRNDNQAVGSTLNRSSENGLVKQLTKHFASST